MAETATPCAQVAAASLWSCANFRTVSFLDDLRHLEALEDKTFARSLFLNIEGQGCLEAAPATWLRDHILLSVEIVRADQPYEIEEDVPLTGEVFGTSQLVTQLAEEL